MGSIVRQTLQIFGHKTRQAWLHSDAKPRAQHSYKEFKFFTQSKMIRLTFEKQTFSIISIPIRCHHDYLTFQTEKQ